MTSEGCVSEEQGWGNRGVWWSELGVQSKYELKMWQTYFYDGKKSVWG